MDDPMNASDPLWYRARGIITVRNGRVHRHWIELRSRRTDEYVGTEPLVSADSDVWQDHGKPWTDESQKNFIQYEKRRNSGRLWRRCE
jgi:hypothetical protein